MPGRGPPPQPTVVRLRNGNPGKRPINEHEPKYRDAAADGVPPPPWPLCTRASAHWLELAPQLHEAGVLATVDLDALAEYCQHWVTFELAQEQLAAHGHVLSGGAMDRPSPWVGIGNEAARALHRLRGEFGLTPSSRTRISTNAGSTKKDNDPKAKARRLLRSG